MKVRILSDLHLELPDRQSYSAIVDDVECDAVVLAGDIANGTDGLDWAANTFGRPVIYVMGNHEYYGHDAQTLLSQAREKAHALGIHLLECDEVTLEGTRFVGCTLWSDFGVASTKTDEVRSRRMAEQLLPDCRLITNHGATLDTKGMIEWHQSSRDWLAHNLNVSQPAVAITHFVPTPQLTNPQFGVDDDLTPYFHTNLEGLMGDAVPFWIYGHNHYTAAGEIVTERGITYVVSNQLGYPKEGQGFEHDFVLTV